MLTSPTRRSWLWKGALALVLLLAAAVGLLGFALRDNPARPAVGQAKTVRSGDAEIRYFVGGPRDGGAVALVPSFGRSASDFNELVADLHAAGCRTLAMQPRGIDGSTLPSSEVTLHTYAADLAAVVEAELGSEPVAVLGHAWGNRVARTFATDSPERTNTLVLLAAGGAKPTAPEMTEAIGTALFAFWPEATRREAIELAFFAEGNPVPDEWMRGWYPRAGLAQARANATTLYDEWGAGEASPLLVLELAEDAVAPGAGEALRRRFPERVRVELIQGAGHAALPEQRERISRALLAYLPSRCQGS